ncbi:MAG: chromate efflux transporter [Verrucomicrobia bacterium]|nr:chromate efflux transporter [Verrucomicrobiota bacterium]
MNSPERKPPGFAEAVRLWLKIGCIGFGGPSGQIAILHCEVVEQRKWIGEGEFARALQFCMLLPGPEAQQLATWIGWRLHGIRGGVVAGTLFVLPAALLLWGLGVLYVLGRDWPLLHGFFEGLKPAVVAIVLSALWRIARRTVTSVPLAIMALVAFALFLLHASYPAVVIGFGLAGALLISKKGEPTPPPVPTEAGWSGSCRVALATTALWALPVAGLLFWLGSDALPSRIALFFAKVAVLSFGGAYAALSYVSLHASGDWGWITPGEMLDGLGLAETTPGPLLIALQFVAFLAAYKSPGILAPLLSATLGSLAALWSLFLPSFLWIFSLAPHMEWLASHRRMAGALAAIGAVVTAVIAHLALWFAGSVFMTQSSSGTSFHPLSIVMALVALVLLRTNRLGIASLILLSGMTGVLVRLVT